MSETEVRGVVREEGEGEETVRKRRYGQGLFLGVLGALLVLPLTGSLTDIWLQALAFIAFDLLVYSVPRARTVLKGLVVGQTVGWIIYLFVVVLMFGMLLALSTVFGAQ